MSLIRHVVRRRGPRWAMFRPNTARHASVHGDAPDETSSSSEEPPSSEKGARSLSPGQRAFLTIGAAVGAFVNPQRGYLVAILGETTGEFHLEKIRDRMKLDPEGRKILAERPRPRDDINLDDLLQLPINTFGFAYGEYMKQHDFTQEGRSTVKYIEDPELAYVLQRYREVHDFWHTLVDLPPTVFGEVTQKWLEMLQTGLPMPTLAAIVGSLRVPGTEKQRILKEAVPWALACHSKCAFLMNVRYEDYLEEDLDTVRKQLGIITFPDFTKQRTQPT